MSNKNDQLKKLMIDQLAKTPIVSVACEKVGLSRSTYYRLRKSGKKFAQACDKSQREGVLLINDMAESQLLTAIRDNNLTAVIYWLKNHHPDYEERLAVRAIQNEPIQLTAKQQAEVERALQLGGLLVAKTNEQNDESPTK